MDGKGERKVNRLCEQLLDMISDAVVRMGKSGLKKSITLTFNVSTDGTLGMAFTPLRNSQTVGAEVAWYKKANTSYKYYSWNNNGECGKYKLGARLDTLITNGYGHGKGYWNAY